MSDYIKKSLDLNTCLPSRFRDQSLSLIIKNLFNRHLTKDETIPFFGYVGSSTFADANDIYVPAPDLDRAVNSLTPAMYVKHATVQRAFTWSDIIQKLEILGVDIADINSWAASSAYNWAPPIDLDKFVNFSEYYWIGNWVLAAIDDLINDFDFELGLTTPTLQNQIYGIQVTPQYYGADDTFTIHFTTATDFTITSAVLGSTTWIRVPGEETIVDANIGLDHLLQFTLRDYAFQAGDTIVFKYNVGSNIYADIFYNVDPTLNLLDCRYTLYIKEHIDTWNPTYSEDYYVIKRPDSGVNLGYQSTAAPTFASPWSIGNFWVHKNDIDAFINGVNAPAFKMGDLIQASRPIIEYSNLLQQCRYLDSVTGMPDDYRNFVQNYSQAKTGPNQPPLFDLFDADGNHIHKISPVFYYAEGNNYPIDSIINRRLVTDEFGEFTFEQGLLIDANGNTTNADTDQHQLFYKMGTPNDVATLHNIWSNARTVTPELVTIEQAGSIINVDKFNNYQNYYWVKPAVIPAGLITINGANAGEPEYMVIEKIQSSTSGWALYNYWTHITEIDSALVSQYIQAQRPIIEFNSSIEGPLVAKTAFNQLPTFQLYKYDTTTSTYVTVTTDLIAGKHLLLRDDDLSAVELLGNSRLDHVANSALVVNGQKYFQSFLSYTFGLDQSGVQYLAAGGQTGTLVPTITSTCGVQDWSIRVTSLSAPQWTVVGSVDGVVGTATTGTPFNLGGISFTITTSGGISLGNFFKFKFIELDNINLYVNYGNNVYKTIKTVDELLDPPAVQKIISYSGANSTLKVPEPIFFNLNNDNRKQIKQGDLYYHFSSIISAQTGLAGGALSSNNYRKLTPDLSKGGRIKQYSKDWNIFVGLLNQQNITPLSILEFAKKGYAQLENQIIEYVLTDGVDEIIASTAGFKNYIKRQNAIVTTSTTGVDDNIARLFYDTTAPIDNIPVTLPMLGLAQLVQPVRTFAPDLGYNVQVHHDGHRTKEYEVDLDTIKKYVNKSFLRSNGQISAGSVTANVTPGRPFKNQFWYNTVTGILKQYNVLSDTGEQPVGGIGYSYDRAQDILYIGNGSSWSVYGGAATDPWTTVPNYVAEITQAIENEIYNHTYNSVTLATYDGDPTFDQNMETYLIKFGQRHGIDNVYNSYYDPSNSFTWNYKQVVVSPLSQAYATWQDLYTAYYGTPRPDLYPWIVVGQSQAAFLLTLSSLSITPFTSLMWSYVKMAIGGKPLSVNTATNTLLPPYLPLSDVNSNEALLTTQPAGITNQFVYGDHGPTERAWRASVDFRYDYAKCAFKKDPIQFISTYWGHYVKPTTTGYEYYVESSKKLRQSELKLHGEPRTKLSQNGNVIISAFGGAVAVPISYHITVTNRALNQIKIQRVGSSVPDGEAPTFKFFGATYTDVAYGISFRLEDSALPGMYLGDKVTVTLPLGATSAGDVDIEFIPTTMYQFRGLNQLYVQLLRAQSSSLDTEMNVSILRDWDCLLSYRAGGFVNTDTVKISADNFSLTTDSNDVNILIKENRYLSNNWLSALNVKLVMVGSTTGLNGYTIPAGPAFAAGTDWVFRIDLFNNRKPNLKFNVFDETGDVTTFGVLNGDRCPVSWKQYSTVIDTLKIDAPLLITGIQSLITFIYGYVSYLEQEGWRFNNSENPLVDAETGRLIGWQLEIERMLESLYSSAPAGREWILNPFKTNVWFAPARGVVNDFSKTNIYDVEATQSILNIEGREINRNAIRVFRDDELTEIVSDDPMYTVHLTTSEYEHLFLFNNYSASTNLIYDAFLGQRIARLKFDGQKQVIFNGRLSFGGQYVNDSSMRKNIEASVDDVLKYYDSDLNVDTSPELDRARALVNYTQKDYFTELNVPNRTSFKFWQGMIKNKGSNFVVDAFLNSRNYDTASLDEFWAFKIAEYGDARLIQSPEIKVSLDHVSTDQTRYRFFELGELEVDASNAYDINNYEQYQLDGKIAASYFYEDIHTPGLIPVKPTDEKIWMSLDDLNTHEYFEAELIFKKIIVPTSTTALYSIVDEHDKTVISEMFEIIDESDSKKKRYYERGELVTSGVYDEPSFKRINASTVQITNAALLGHTLRINCYGRPLKRYGPFRVVDYIDSTTTSTGLILWDPANGYHNQTAFHEVDIVGDVNPAKYNTSNFTAGFIQYDPTRAWDEKQVGKIWWNTKNLAYKPYADSKIYTQLDERLAKWGSKADYSSMEVYQWTEASVPPAEFVSYVSDANDEISSGTPAIKNVLVRGRKWQHREIAWKYSENPSVTPRGFVTSTTARIKLDSSEIGTTYGTLSIGRLSEAGLSTGMKLSNAIYSDATKAELLSIFGESQIVGEETFVIGSSDVYEDGGIFVTQILVGDSPQAYLSDFAVTVNSTALSTYLTDVSGNIVFDAEYDNDTETYFIRATCTKNSKSQRLPITDLPIKANTLVSYVFDELGITISAKTIYNHIDSWPGGVGVTNPTTVALRQQIAAMQFGNPSHNVYIRSKVELFNLVPFTFDYKAGDLEQSITTTELFSMLDEIELSWVAWTDPTDLESDSPYPFNRWEPMYGAYRDIGSALQTLDSRIIAEAASPFTTRLNQVIKKYGYIWSAWEITEDDVLSVKYTGETSFFEDNFIITISAISDIRQRVSVYVNGEKLTNTQWYFGNHSDVTIVNPVVNITSKLSLGDLVTVYIKKYEPSLDELTFDPDLFPLKDDPTRLLQYKEDYPYTKTVSVSADGVKANPRYFFWVKDSTTKSSKKLAVRRIAELLNYNDDPHCVFAGLKHTNQENGRPPRFALLIIRNFNHFIGANDRYALRLNTNFGLRENDNQLDLKNYHKEWILIREQQSIKIPRVLWDRLENTICGQTSIGDTVPSYRRTQYDKRYNTSTSYGFEIDQVLLDRETAIQTVIYTILNTKVNKYIDGVGLVPDLISFTNFSGMTDISQLATYLSNPTSARILLDFIWVLAKPKQINEIFFAILNDSLTKNKKLADMFKTSYVALQSIIPVQTDNLINTIEYY